MSNNLLAMLNNEDAATLTEYSLIVGLVAVACVFALQTFAAKIQILLNAATTQF